MSGPSDKARFYMEQAVPQLQEFEQKKIFTKEEITNLVKTRSTHEHRILAPRAPPSAFARYLAWEISLESLRQKRYRRLRIKGSSAHHGRSRIYQLYTRTTKKHPGDIGLWMSYLEYTRKEKANRKFKEVMTAALRLHPTNEKLWMYAAIWSLEEEGDLKEARGWLQRGTRFCNQTSKVWVLYARVEMLYLAKIEGRRRVLGLDGPAIGDEEEIGDGGLNSTADIISFLDFKSTTSPPKMEGINVDDEAVKDPINTPALQGAIPMAIFDAARKESFFCVAAAEAFFDMFAEFSQVRSLTKILQHVLDAMMELYEKDAETWNCYLRQPLVGLEPSSAAFAAALGTSLDRLKDAFETKDKAKLEKKMKVWINSLLELKDLDPGVRTVLEHMLRKAAP